MSNLSQIFKANIGGLAEGLTLDSANAPITLVYADATRGRVFGG